MALEKGLIKFDECGLICENFLREFMREFENGGQFLT